MSTNALTTVTARWIGPHPRFGFLVSTTSHHHHDARLMKGYLHSNVPFPIDNNFDARLHHVFSSRH
ncbi:hypothetical protein BKA93DRAFT_811250, partial [Sparassis latifolia]